MPDPNKAILKAPTAVDSILSGFFMFVDKVLLNS